MIPTSFSLALLALTSLSALSAFAEAKKTGKQIYTESCMQCHTTGANKAPIVGDKVAWRPRLKEGLAELTHDVLKGKGAMPPNAGNPKLTRREIQQAIVYMANESGANWKEPK
jgi:cytochrome c5